MTQEQAYQALQKSTISVFSTMLNLTVSPGEPCEKVDPPPINGVMALLGFTGEWIGTGVLFCQEKLAMRLSAAMLLNDVSEISPDVLDGIGELANMVFGNFKDNLEPISGALAISIPTVVYGRNFQARSPGNRAWLVAPFTVDDDTFEARVCLLPKKNQPAPGRR